MCLSEKCTLGFIGLGFFMCYKHKWRDLGRASFLPSVHGLNSTRMVCLVGICVKGFHNCSGNAHMLVYEANYVCHYLMEGRSRLCCAFPTFQRSMFHLIARNLMQLYCHLWKINVTISPLKYELLAMWLLVDWACEGIANETQTCKLQETSVWMWQTVQFKCLKVAA